MNYAVKNKRKVVKAYCLGAASEMETFLLEQGAIRRRPTGEYELFSQEAVNGSGQIAQPGDFFKVDVKVDEAGNQRCFPYPNDRAYFLSHHRHLSGDDYEQINQPLAIWRATDEMCEEVQYLLETGKLILKPEDPERYFNAFLWGADLSAGKDATLIFYSVDRDESGAITDISFNFVAAAEFEANYTIL